MFVPVTTRVSLLFAARNDGNGCASDDCLSTVKQQYQWRVAREVEFNTRTAVAAIVAFLRVLWVRLYIVGRCSRQLERPYAACDDVIVHDATAAATNHGRSP